MRLRALLVLPALILVGVALPASAAAAPSVGVVAVAGSGPGDLVRVTGSGFTAGEDVALALAGSTASTVLGEVTADETGAVTTFGDIRVPVSTTPGWYHLTMTAHGVTARSPKFAILAPRATVPVKLTPGSNACCSIDADRIELVGLASTPDVRRTVTIDGAPVTSHWYETADAFTFAGIAFTVPNTLSVGIHSVTFTQTGATPYTATASVPVLAPTVTATASVIQGNSVDVGVRNAGRLDYFDVSLVGAAGDRRTGGFSGNLDQANGSIGIGTLSAGTATLTVISRHNGATASTTFVVEPVAVPAAGGLAPGKRIVTSYGTTEVDMQTDGNLVEREQGRVVWSSRTQSHPGARLTVQTDGNVVVRGTDGRALWSTGTAGIGAGARFGFPTAEGYPADPFVSTAAGRPAWTSRPGIRGGVFQGEVFFKGETVTEELGPTHDRASFSVQSDGNAVIRTVRRGVVWSTRTAGHPNAYLTLQTDGNLVLRSASGAVLWANGVRGVPNAQVYMDGDGQLIETTHNRTVWHTVLR